MGLFLMVLTIRTKEWMIQQKYNVTDGVNYRADMNKFTHAGGQFKNWHHVY